MTQRLQRSTITIRIPQPEFFNVFDRIKSLGNVLIENAGSEDVTERFIDLEARLKSASREELSLLSLLERAEKVSEILPTGWPPPRVVGPARWLDR